MWKKEEKKISVGKNAEKQMWYEWNICGISFFLCEMNLNNGHNNIPPKATVVSSLKV